MRADCPKLKPSASESSEGDDTADEGGDAAKESERIETTIKELQLQLQDKKAQEERATPAVAGANMLTTSIPCSDTSSLSPAALQRVMNAMLRQK